jgi:hypothetical protein
MSRSGDALDAEVIRLGTLLEAGEATHGLQAKRSRGGIVLSRDEQDRPEPALRPDPRFRLTPLRAGHFGLSLYRRGRWEPIPFEGTLHELVDVMNTELAPWAGPD